MAENKQYITQEQENGKVMIAEDVVTTIITQAVAEVEGMAGLTERKNRRIRVTISENEELTVDCNILVHYGQSVVDVATAVQEAITTAVESTTGVKVTAVNVSVCGIERP